MLNKYYLLLLDCPQQILANARIVMRAVDAVCVIMSAEGLAFDNLYKKEKTIFSFFPF